MLETIEGSIYDFPKCYDLAYGSDWKAEFDFLGECFRRHARGAVRRVFEPACGTGRLLFRMAKAGYEVSGIDLSAKAVDFCNARLARHGFARAASLGDMTAFTLPRRVDAAFNTINSFRHLASERQAIDHLRYMARCVRKGGVYVLGLNLTPTAAAPTEQESWSSQRGQLAILSRLWVIERNLRKRQERVGMSFDVYTPTRQFRITDQSCFRTYTARQMEQLLRRVDEFEIKSVHDFGYDTDRAVAIDESSEDVVFVLGRR